MSMRRRSREVSVFGASALDLFASALAAFIVITLMVLPFFLKYDEVLIQQVTDLQGQLADTTQQLDQTRAELDQSQAQLGQAQADLDATRAALEDCQQDRISVGQELAQCVEDLSSTFMTVLIRWGNVNDVDLHVTDPSGNEFYFAESTFPGVPGELTEDVVTGPGVEVFEVADAPLGTYRIEYVLYSDAGGPVNVGGAVYSRQGRQELPVVRLNDANPDANIAVATATVTADGSVNLTFN